MSKKDKRKPIVEMIDFDERTQEPVIVTLPDGEIPAQVAFDAEQVEPIKKADFFEETTSARSVGKQMVMKGLGLNSKENELINKRQRLFKSLFTVVFVVFVIGVLIFTFYKDFFGRQDKFPSGEELLGILSEGWKFFMLGLFALFLAYLFKALKLSVLCKSLSGKFHFKTCFETGIIGHYYNYVTPLAVGGQPFEIYHLSRHGIRGGIATSLPIATYVLNQFAFVIIGIVFMIMFKYNTLGMSDSLYNTFPTAFMVMAIVGLSFCFLMPFLIFLFCLMPKFGAMLVRIAVFIGAKLRLIRNPKKTTYRLIKNIIHNTQCLKKIFSRPIPAIICFIFSFGEHIASASIAYFALKTFAFTSGEGNILLEWLQIVQIVMLLTYAISFIPTPGNAGAADLSFYLLFSTSLAAGLAFPAMVLWRMMAFYSFIVIGFIFATLKKNSDNRKARLNKSIE